MEKKNQEVKILHMMQFQHNLFGILLTGPIRKESFKTNRSHFGKDTS